MKKIVLILIVSILFVSFLAAEESTDHSISFNIGAPHYLLSTEFEYSFPSTSKQRISLSAGTDIGVTSFAFPVGINYSLGQQNQLILGLYITPVFMRCLDFLYGVSWEVDPGISPKLGYRRVFNTSKRKIFAQIYYSPLLIIDYPPLFNYDNLYFIHNVSIGFGFYLN